MNTNDAPAFLTAVHEMTPAWFHDETSGPRRAASAGAAATATTTTADAKVRRNRDVLDMRWPPPRLRKRTCRVRAEVALLYGFTPRRNEPPCRCSRSCRVGRCGRPRQDSAMGEGQPDNARLSYRVGHLKAVPGATHGDRYQSRGRAPSIWPDVRSAGRVDLGELSGCDGSRGRSSNDGPEAER